MPESPRPTVYVLNQFALPLSEGGGTRHTELFSRLEGWDHRIVAGSRNHYTQKRFTTDDDHFLLTAVTPQKGGAPARALGWVLYSVQAAATVIRAPRVDAVYASSPHPLTPLAGWVAARVRRVPFILEVRDLWPESIVSAGKMREGSLVHRIFSAIERFEVRRADAVVGVTEGWEEHFAQLGARSLTVVPNGAEYRGRSETTSRFQPEDVRPDVPGPFGIFAGAHGPKDGIDAILDAAADHPEVGFTLIGSGAMKAPAMERARRENLRNVRFLDPVAKSELPELLACFDFGIHSVSPLPVFRKGMSPNKLFDYLAHDLPVASNAGAALDRVVADGAVGVITDDLSVSLQGLLEAPMEARRAWKVRGQSLMEGPYSRDQSAMTLKRLLESAGSGRR